MNFKNKLLNFVTNSDLGEEEKKDFLKIISNFSERNCQQIYFAIIKSPKKIKQVYQNIRDRVDIANKVFQTTAFNREQFDVLLNEIFSLSDEQIKQIQNSKAEVADINGKKMAEINNDFKNEQKDLRETLDKFLEITKSQIDGYVSEACK